MTLKQRGYKKCFRCGAIQKKDREKCRVCQMNFETHKSERKGVLERAHVI